MALEQAISQSELKGKAKDKIKDKAKEQELIISLKQKLTKFGYTAGEVEYIIKNCSSNPEIVQKLKSQLDIAQKCLKVQ
ncbi:hypothetical protein SAMN05660649_03761 [Desulfotomaculum arcticum]|uniref:Uncharacterized protein n=1 Tax=Desulfotruncus arcticus DSM 17038 TaxID=1121424 RepID=A0A1I2X1C1_9FIRM|nr:hypothetical protein [Desulfotruncus arcticus]SFH07364.1 hypothetical protein SAMN05660649_03761 [Desulfotomaculum arcticum] [Desulfotruncus arcticus DSM 17038]